MISKQKSKFLNSLQVKKYRQLHQCFLVQGAKSVLEIFESDYEVTALYCTQAFFNEYHDRLPELPELEICTESELAKVSAFQSNNSVLAVVQMKAETTSTLAADGFYLALDRVGDPGNLGTIIRLADWYGVKTIICSSDCADVFNPKVIAATMGAFTRVHVVYTDLKTCLKSYSGTIYGAYLEGENVHALAPASFKGILLMGSESHGISANLASLVNKKVTIPKFGGAESLNVAVATGIILDNLRRGC